MVRASLGGLYSKVTVVDAERGVEPIHLGADERFRDEAVGRDNLDDLGQVSVLASELDLCYGSARAYRLVLQELTYTLVSDLIARDAPRVGGGRGTRDVELSCEMIEGAEGDHCSSVGS